MTTGGLLLNKQPMKILVIHNDQTKTVIHSKNYKEAARELYGRAATVEQKGKGKHTFNILIDRKRVAVAKFIN
jgi:hypothetical protein